MQIDNESALIIACQKGDKAAFSVLYKATIRPIYTFVFYRTHHKETAEDLVSQVFFKAFREIASFNAEKGTFTTWLYQIARNTVIDHYRKRKPEVAIEEALDITARGDLAKDIEVKMDLENAQTLLSKLSREERTVVVMRVWEEMSHKEIAEVLGKTEASSKMAFSRAIKKLKELRGADAVTQEPKHS